MGQTRWLVAIYFIMTLKWMDFCNAQRTVLWDTLELFGSVWDIAAYIWVFCLFFIYSIPNCRGRVHFCCPILSIFETCLSLRGGPGLLPGSSCDCCRHQRAQLKHFLQPLLILGGGRCMMSDSSSPSQSSAPYPVATKKSRVIIGAYSSCFCHIRLTSKCPQGLQQGGIPHTAFQICHLPFKSQWWRCWVTATDT